MTVPTAVPLDVLYVATVQVTGGRGGSARSLTGALQVELTRPAQRGPDAPGTDPEELFAAGYAACFDSALAVAARQEKVSTGPTSVTASVSLGRTADERYAIAVELAVSAPDCPQGELERVVAAADRLCPYSNAVRGNTPVTIRVDGRS
ncbi:Ohr family peroxiredoxin [Phytohabitans sp. ZYX-F-186]|uniref:Ohr family peroxiredoxin n=1 Tax=Phytohabitans maris TaxID=3071409 RepID=A0ABU0ZH56_9ACTN|nr:Ohr family peroxiredoxin [Phytohabitans sp. ZYX-F-186]MDQ7905739.1 Ohr family peroxiredoxin [Phytohabitans sp. ZYX-F-186]